MFRKLLALIALAALVWLGARYFAHRGEVKATIVFHEAGTLRKGDPIVENGETIGRVTGITPLDGQVAVGIRLDRSHRRAIVTDSLFAAEDHRIVVTNTFAIGKPIDDGAVLRAKDDNRFSRWLAKNAAAVQPFVDKLKRAADQQLDSLDKELASASAKMPQWKKEGKDAFDEHVEELKKKVEKAEKDLEKTDHKAEARKLREKFDRWLAEVRR